MDVISNFSKVSLKAVLNFKSNFQQLRRQNFGLVRAQSVVNGNVSFAITNSITEKQLFSLLSDIICQVCNFKTKVHLKVDCCITLLCLISKF